MATTNAFAEVARFAISAVALILLLTAIDMAVSAGLIWLVLRVFSGSNAGA